MLSSTRYAHKYYALLHTGIYFLTVRISLHILNVLSMIEYKNILQVTLPEIKYRSSIVGKFLNGKNNIFKRWNCFEYQFFSSIWQQRPVCYTVEVAHCLTRARETRVGETAKAIYTRVVFLIATMCNNNKDILTAKCFFF